MPLLPLEPFVQPSDLFDRPRVDDSPKQWWVLHSRPRAEKTLARNLFEKEAAFFLPLYKKQQYSKGRLSSSYIPLFPGYLFLYGDHETRLTALETNRVARVIPVADQTRLLNDLRQIHTLMASGASFTHEATLQPGTPVEITTGSLAGLRGTILEAKNQMRFVVAVQFLQQGASVEVPSWMIQSTAKCAG